MGSFPPIFSYLDNQDINAVVFFFLLKEKKEERKTFNRLLDLSHSLKEKMLSSQLFVKENPHNCHSGWGILWTLRSFFWKIHGPTYVINSLSSFCMTLPLSFHDFTEIAFLSTTALHQSNCALSPKELIVWAKRSIAGNPQHIKSAQLFSKRTDWYGHITTFRESVFGQTNKALFKLVFETNNAYLGSCRGRICF